MIRTLATCAVLLVTGIAGYSIGAQSARGSSAHRSEPASRRRAAAAVHAGRDGG